MRDKRPVDELSVEELEHVLAIKKREERQQRMQRMQRDGRVIEVIEVQDAPPPSDPQPMLEAAVPAQDHDPVAAALAALTQPVTPSVPKDAAPQFDERAETVTARPVNKRARRRVFDRVLLLIEVLAVVLIAAIGVNLLQSINLMQTVTASAQQSAEELRRQTIPTIAPTAEIHLENIVLPDGHSFAADGSPQFNYNEVPAQFYPRVQSEWIQPVLNRPPQTSETALALIIPKLNLNATIVQGVDWEALKQGVGQVTNGVNPGDDVGNVSFAAHNDIYGKLFQHLDQLQAGDTFQIQTRTSVYTYTVTDQQIVAPNDVGVLNSRQGATATLISCYPYQVDTKRIVIFADRVS